MTGQVDNGDKFVNAVKCLQECRSENNYSLYMRLAGIDRTRLVEAIKHNSTIAQMTDLSDNLLGPGDCTTLIEKQSNITQP